MATPTEQSTVQRYLAWRRGNRMPLSPNSFLIGLAVMIPLAIAVGIFGPDGDGAGATVVRSLVIGLGVGALITFLMWRERRRHEGVPPA